MIRKALQGTILAALLCCGANTAAADERFFTYVYEADAMAEGQWEFEQWVTNQNGRKEGDYSQWNFRSEFEYGITSALTTALYLNWDSTRSENMPGEDDINDTTFKGVSSEWTYQVLNPILDPVGFSLYGEVTTDGVDVEAEGKLIVSKVIDDIVLAANAEYEAEWEDEDGFTEKEAYLSFYLGVAYRFSPQWSVGLEARNKSAYPDGLDLSGQEFQTWNVGPNLHYGAKDWWATFTVLPQVWGNGDGSSGGRNLGHEEEVEVRLIVGVHL